jgi:asparagine synthase (glutamine-hydrolysing)
MCGIAGICTVEPQPYDNLILSLNKMKQLMVHRGPDDGGVWVDENRMCGLANRRLAIIDLSANGHMPMADVNGTYAITYNGEVYNFTEIRTELENIGHRFRSDADTEVILQAYLQWGKDCVHRLRGMFAFAIWNSENQTLFAARDRLGIKPFYYTAIGDMFCFASELTVLRRAASNLGEINPMAVGAYLQLGYIPNSLTIYRTAVALPPAHYLTWRNGEVEVERYWEIPNEVHPASREEALEEISVTLEDSVRMRMVADVPVGAFLSGGLDSSSAVALMRQVSNNTLRTCSITFDEKDYSEAGWAQEVAQAFGADHHDCLITAKDVADEFEQIIRHIDQPSIDGVNTYFASKVASEAGLTVAISGLGGDELFAGYPNTFEGVPTLSKAMAWAHAIPGGTFAARTAIRAMPNQYRWAKLKEGLERPPSFANSYLIRRGLFPSQEVRALLHDDFWRNGSDAFDPVAYIQQTTSDTSLDPFYWVSKTELQTYTQNQLLHTTDVMSMAHSLEVRVPFLDHVLVEKIHSLPATFHRNEDMTKPFLRAIVQGKLPDKVLHRRDKQGFTFPFADWMRHDLRPLVRESLAPDRVAATGVLNGPAVDRLISQFEAGKVSWSRLWSLVVLSAWMTQMR